MAKHLLASRLDAIAPSLTLAISARAKQMKKDGHHVINFSAGEPDFDTPAPIKEAAKRALDEGYTKYTPEDGFLELKQALIARLETDLGYHYAPNEVCFSNGAKQAIYNLFCATINPGDQVIIPAPYWLSFPEIAKLCDASVVIVDTKNENGYRLTPSELKASITPQTKWLVLNSPSNPTGAVYSRKELQNLAEILSAHPDILILSDETYYRLIFDNLPFASPVHLGGEIAKRTLVVGSLSKTYAMTGWRLGYALGDATIIKACATIQGQTTSNANSIAQRAAIFALQGDHQEMDRMKAAFEKRRNLTFDLVCRIPRLLPTRPLAAFYLFCDFSAYYNRSFEKHTVRDSATLAQYLLETEKVACVPGAAFGCDTHLRISFATSEADIREGFQRIQRALERLR